MTQESVNARGLPTQEAVLVEALQALNASLEAVLAVLRRLEDEASWIPIKEASTRLKVNRQWILARIRNGAYKHGVHFINTSDGDRPNYLVSVSAIRKELIKPPEKRKSGTISARK